MISFKLSRRKKNLAIAGEREKREALWKEQSLLSTKSRLESFFDEQARKRISHPRWCRACLSDDCCLDHVSEPAICEGDKEASGDEFTEMLKSIKQRRVATEDYIDHIEKLNAICNVGLLSYPYLPSQRGLPPWLLFILEQELIIPVVPTFPASKKALVELMSELDVRYPSDSLMGDYKHAASYARRVRVGVTSDSHMRHFSMSASVPNIFVCEDVSDGRAPAEMDGEKRGAGCGKRDSFVQKYCQNITPSSTLSIDTLSAMITDMISIRDDNAVSKMDDLQLLDICLDWETLYVCSMASLTECRNERVMISGVLNTDTNSNLQFKLLLFPGERTSETSMRLKGTFLRTAEQSGYNLRWKYDINIPATRLRG